MTPTAGASSSPLALRIASRLAVSARGELNKRAARRLLPAILERLEATQHGGRRLRVHALDVTSGGRVAVHVGADQPTAIVKLAKRFSHRQSVRRQARMLHLVHGCEGLGDFRALVPQPLLAGELERWTYLVESRLAGRPANGVPAEPEFERNALAAIQRLHEATAREVVVDGRQLDRWVRRRARTASLALARHFDPSAAQPLDNVVTELAEILAGRSLRVGWIHGDYWAGNILVAGGSITGVLDWDSMRGNELPLHDVVHLLVTQQRLRERRPWGSVVRELLLAPRPAQLERGLPELGPALASLTWRGALLMYWLHVIAASLRRHPGPTGSRAWLAANVTPVLEAWG